MRKTAPKGLMVCPEYQPIFRQIGLDGPAVFDDPRIVAWRTLPDRQNCTLDEDLPSGVHLRWHIKRYTIAANAVMDEVAGHQALVDAGLPTAPLAAYGHLDDGRGFVIFDDLAGYRPADRRVMDGTPFATLLEPTADLAASLHNAGLHHRDLYLCHFMARIIGTAVDLKLIDVARVKKLPARWMRRRWIVKDLAQFWYSTLKLSVSDDQRAQWLARYAERRGIKGAKSLGARIERKSRSIARHDARLHRDRPERDVSIPQGPVGRVP